MTTRRREFIPELRQHIVETLIKQAAFWKESPTADTINTAIDAWRDGKAPDGFMQGATFEACDFIARSLDDMEVKS